MQETEPRGLVGFEVVLGALLAALDGGVIGLPYLRWRAVSYTT